LIVAVSRRLHTPVDVVMNWEIDFFLETVSSLGRVLKAENAPPPNR
jgi:hypothetical protein